MRLTKPPKRTRKPDRTPRPIPPPPVPKKLYPQNFTDLVRAELNKPEWKVSNLKIETSFENDTDIGPEQLDIIIRQSVGLDAKRNGDIHNGWYIIEGNIMDGYKKLIDQTTDEFDPMLFHIEYHKVSQYDRSRITSYFMVVEYKLYDRQVADDAKVTNYNALDTENYVKIADNWMNRAILCAVLFWVVCGPFALVWAVMKYQKKKNYQKVAAFVDTETEDDSK